MAADAKSFGIALGVNAAICFICFIVFCTSRVGRLLRKFYMPRQYQTSRWRAGRPYQLPQTFAGWVAPAWSTSQDEIIRVAGYDAAMYIKALSFAFESIVWISFWCLIIVLPTNLVGHEVSTLTASGNVPTSPYTYWVPPSPAPSTDAPPSPQQPQSIKAPSFYAPTPPAPAGLQWWTYNAGVPPLPDPGSVLGQNYSSYAWRYDAKYSAESYTFSQLDNATMSNLSPNSGLLYVSAIASWFVAFVVMRALSRYTKAAVDLHLQYLSHSGNGVETHTVLVTDIPGASAGTVTGIVPEKVRKGIADGASKSRIPQVLQSSTTKVLPSSVRSRRPGEITNLEETESGKLTDGDIESGESPHSATRRQPREPDLNAWAHALQLLRSGMTVEELVRNEYEELFAGEEVAANIVYNTNSLDPLVKEYDGMLRDLEDLIDDYASQKSRGKDVKRKETRVLGFKYGEWGRKNYPGVKGAKADLMDWYVKRLTELRRLILEEQETCSKRPGPTAFVTFQSRRAQTIACNSLQHPDVSAWHVAAAAEPNDVLWGNVRKRAWERQSRFVTVWVLFSLLALFYTIPIGAIQAIIEVNRLEKIVVFKQLVSVAFVRSLIEAILPGLVLNIFLSILPMLLSFMNKQQGMFSSTEVDFGVIRKYFIFLIITVFLGSFIGGALFNQFNQWINDPTSAITILGTAAPLTSIFFLTYIQLQAFTSLPFSFLRVIGLVLYSIQSKFAATPRAKARLGTEQQYKYGPQLPRHMLILFVGIVFSVINPLVPVMTIIYFAVALLTERYNLLYVYTPIFESGGKMWAEIYEQVICALFFFEAIMVVLLAIKKSYSAILIAPLIVVTTIFWLSTKPVFKKPMSSLSLRTAVDLDYNDRLTEGDSALEDEGKSKKASYLMPAMDFDEMRHETVLQEAEDMDLALQGKREFRPQSMPDEDEEEEGRPLSRSPGTQTNKAGYSSQHSTRSMQPLVQAGIAQQGTLDSASPDNLEPSRTEVMMVPLDEESAAGDGSVRTKA